MTTEASFLPTEAESESTSSLKRQLLQSFQTSKEYRHAFVEESIRSGLAAQTRAIRETRKMDPKAFAEQLGKKVSWIYRLEDPNAPAPTIASLLEVAKAFDVDLQVRFRPFSERLDDLSKLSAKSFTVPSFADELPDLEQNDDAAHKLSGLMMSAVGCSNSTDYLSYRSIQHTNLVSITDLRRQRASESTSHKTMNVAYTSNSSCEWKGVINGR
jgi:transcriptional regulator with XRE-family HTH domain